MEGCTSFLLDWLIEGRGGYLETNPSTSPEHTFIAPDRKPASVSYSTTMDIAIIKEVFSAMVSAAEVRLLCNKYFSKARPVWSGGGSYGDPVLGELDLHMNQLDKLVITRSNPALAVLILSFLNYTITWSFCVLDLLVSGEPWAPSAAGSMSCAVLEACLCSLYMLSSLRWYADLGKGRWCTC